MPLEVGDLQQQVTSGHPTPAAYGAGQTDAVEGVEPARDDEALDHGARDPGTVPEVRQ